MSEEIDAGELRHRADVPPWHGACEGYAVLRATRRARATSSPAFTVIAVRAQ